MNEDDDAADKGLVGWPWEREEAHAPESENRSHTPDDPSSGPEDWRHQARGQPTPGRG